MERGANCPRHMGPPGHQTAMEQTQREGAFGMVASADFKPSLKEVTLAWFTVRQLKGTAGSKI